MPWFQENKRGLGEKLKWKMEIMLGKTLDNFLPIVICCSQNLWKYMMMNFAKKNTQQCLPSKTKSFRCRKKFKMVSFEFNLNINKIDLICDTGSFAGEVAFIRGQAMNLSQSDFKSEAEEQLSKAVKLLPHHAASWCALGICLWKKGDKHSALSCFLESIKHEPQAAAFSTSPRKRNVTFPNLMAAFQGNSAYLQDKLTFRMELTILLCTQNRPWHLIWVITKTGAFL